MDRQLELTRTSRWWNNQRVRTTCYGAALFIGSLAMIYLLRSDRVALDVRTHHKIQVTGRAEQQGGLTINGIALPYAQHEQDHAFVTSLDDFAVANQGTYNVQFTRTAQFPAENIAFKFKQGDQAYTHAVDYGAAFIPETQEVTFGGDMVLDEIVILYQNGEKHTVRFAEKTVGTK